jgi:hypothetical protein
LITNGARCTGEIKWRIVMAKAAFSRRRLSSAANWTLMDINCYIWSTALCGADISVLREVNQKYLGSFAMWCWRRMEKIVWTDHVRNEEARRRGKSYIQ